MNVVIYVQKFQVFLRHFTLPDNEASANKTKQDNIEIKLTKTHPGFRGFLLAISRSLLNRVT